MPVRRVVLAASCVVVLAAAAYARLPQNGFVWDDGAHILRDPVISAPFGWSSFPKVFHFPERTYWMPTTTLSLALDHAIFGFNPAAYHLESLFWHIFSAIVIMLALWSATNRLWRSMFVAALFAVHPINVESVAWAIERKNVLSLFFGVLVLSVYVRWVKRQRVSTYILLLVLLAAGMLAKALIATLPIALLAFDIWPLHRLERGRSRWHTVRELTIEKLPMLGVCAACALAVRVSFSAANLICPIPLHVRIANAPVAIVQQLAHLLFPVDIPVHHAYGDTVPGLYVAAALVAIAVVSTVAIGLRRRAPYVTAGWFWFLAALVPTLGIIQGGNFPPVSDRFAYLAQIGIMWALTWGVTDLLNHAIPSVAAAAPILGGLVICALVPITVSRTAIWHDSISLFGQAVRNEPNDPTVRYNLGTSLVETGPARIRDGIAHLEIAVRLDPWHAPSYINLGLALAEEGRVEEAVRALTRAVEIAPGNALAHASLGDVLLRAGQFAGALQVYDQAITLDPHQPSWHANAAAALIRLGRYDDAVARLSSAATAGKMTPEMHFNFGVAQAALGHTDAARRELATLSRVAPPLAASLERYLAHTEKKE